MSSTGFKKRHTSPKKGCDDSGELPSPPPVEETQQELVIRLNGVIEHMKKLHAKYLEE